jgi:hypothetical protein
MQPEPAIMGEFDRRTDIKGFRDAIAVQAKRSHQPRDRGKGVRCRRGRRGGGGNRGFNQHNRSTGWKNTEDINTSLEALRPAARVLPRACRPMRERLNYVLVTG